MKKNKKDLGKELMKLIPHHLTAIFIRKILFEKSDDNILHGYDECMNKRIIEIVKLLKKDKSLVSLSWNYDEICKVCCKNPTSNRYKKGYLCTGAQGRGKGRGIFTHMDWSNGYEYDCAYITDEDSAELFKLKEIFQNKPIIPSNLFSSMIKTYEKLSEEDKYILNIKWL